jgi:hypothetical protein
METITTQMPALAAETCANCGAQLSDDQRYCLNCGARRGDARVPFMEILGGRAGGPPPTAVAGARGPTDPRSSRNLTIVASIGCLLLALGVGVLIGHGGRDKGSSGSTQPQVISVQGGGASSAAPAAAGAGAAKTAGNSAKGKSGGSASSSKKSHATNSAIKKLNNLSPEQYQKQSQKLPKTVGTGGKPPPKDKKAPAGGGSFQDFG